MSISMNRQSVNVSRVALLAKLKENLEIHRKDYTEACEGYKINLQKEIEKILEQVKNGSVQQVLKLRPIIFAPPANYEREYQNVIDMMEVSVDENINLDGDSFRAYFKNEWSWSAAFNASATMYKAALGASVN